ncbi:hypothetical protein B1757_07670 [Acidithiobacillus marinus]|uniref:DUF2232 domain-containing protein n=1 Tax=Acidithiobacillus marinus TaxID=187490 RepID=A0A2I1DLT7_9PROT|nr:DUF2232 domain-containing protein [Acidithiobacillus marinus]PKY10826.1 hypothetical protein B1757_07670 [Acidithiobacillus marinus]
MTAQSQGGILRWFLSGRWQAGLSIAVLFSLAGLVPFLAAPLFLNCVALVALVTLQAGRKESLEVLVIAGIASMLFTFNPWFGLLFVLVAWLPGRLLGEGLHWHIQWGGVVWVLIGLSLTTLVLMLWAVPLGAGPTFWQSQMTQMLKPLNTEISKAQMTAVLRMAPLLPGIASAGLVLLWTLAALLASRWHERYQGLEQPQRVYGNLELPGRLIWLLVATLLGIVLVHGAWAWPLQNLALLVGTWYLLQGLSFVHLWFAAKGWPTMALLGLYIVLILLSQLLLVLSVLGMLDRVFHLRHRLLRPRS